MNKIIITLIAWLSISLLYSCAPVESCSDVYVCIADGSTAQTCCTSNDCRFVTASRTFNCNGTSCTAAAENLSSYCYGLSYKAESDLATKLGLEKVKTLQLQGTINDMYNDLGEETQEK